MRLSILSCLLLACGSVNESPPVDSAPAQTTLVLSRFDGPMNNIEVIAHVGNEVRELLTDESGTLRIETEETIHLTIVERDINQDISRLLSYIDVAPGSTLTVPFPDSRQLGSLKVRLPGTYSGGNVTRYRFLGPCVAGETQNPNQDYSGNLFANCLDKDGKITQLAVASNVNESIAATFVTSQSTSLQIATMPTWKTDFGTLSVGTDKLPKAGQSQITPAIVINGARIGSVTAFDEVTHSEKWPLNFATQVEGMFTNMLNSSIDEAEFSTQIIRSEAALPHTFVAKDDDYIAPPVITLDTSGATWTGADVDGHLVGFEVGDIYWLQNIPGNKREATVLPMPDAITIEDVSKATVWAIERDDIESTDFANSIQFNAETMPSQGAAHLRYGRRSTKSLAM